jgi:ubiquinol-cytochrome c reductase cytochrome b subunit
MRGPTLDTVASRMTEDQIIRQVLQGGGNMPAYGNALNPSETTALVHFLLTLHGNLSPAIDASRKMVLSSEQSTPPSSPKPPVPDGH